jgi:hypothetical protein
MRYRLRTLIVMMVLVPPFIAASFWIHDARERAIRMPCVASNLLPLTAAELAQRAANRKPLTPDGKAQSGP